MKAITQYFVISVSTMDIFNALTMIGGLCLFLFGMNVMGQALERRAGNSLRNTLEKLTSNKIAGFLTGLGVTAVIQSSSATTVMVVGFVNSGLMTLRQAINVIMGANVGTTVTGWVLSLGGISSDNIWIRLLKPSSFTPVLALAGIVMYLFMKDSKKKDSGAILLGFSVLMFGMETMSSAVSGLSEVPEFQQLFRDVQKSAFRTFGRHTLDSSYSVKLGLGRHFAGLDGHGTGFDRCGYSDSNGRRYRHMRHGNDIGCRHKERSEACRNGSFADKRYRLNCLGNGILAD